MPAPPLPLPLAACARRGPSPARTPGDLAAVGGGEGDAARQVEIRTP